uniref:PPM-type phosphatase domain-containing protein n=1 Tax=Meloidogyne hapla TaxID=6305 RepID=A0A1I8BPY8_MELHA
MSDNLNVENDILLLKKAISDYLIPDESPSIRVRQRPLFVKTNIQDARAKPCGWDEYSISLCSQRNRRPKMEDRHIVLPSFSVIGSQLPSSDAFFAVFDGHNGSECSAYASAHFLECLLEANSSGSSEDSLLEDAFSRMDIRLTNRCRSEEERHRIEEAGGMVIHVQGIPRLNGVLNLSRSLGDIHARPMVSSKPDVRTYQISENEVDYMIFLSSDGIWDSLEDGEIFETVRLFVTEHLIKADFIAAKAKKADSVDNMTLICICLEPLEAIWSRFAYKEEEHKSH